MEEQKAAVRDFWDANSCGEELYLKGADYQAEGAERYRLEPYIVPFADFQGSRGKRVLEIGVGLGADHEQFARAGALLSGVDLTPRAVAHTTQRLAATGLKSELCVADAERLPFPAEQFDIVYSWGVLHHSPDTPTAVREVWRVLRRGGTARVMIYQKHSLVGFMLWLRYGWMRGLALKDVYSRYLESPGTKAYTTHEAKQLFGDFSQVKVETKLSHGDLLSSEAGQRHRGLALDVARAVWPRWLLRHFPRLGLFLLITATK